MKILLPMWKDKNFIVKMIIFTVTFVFVAVGAGFVSKCKIISLPVEKIEIENGKEVYVNPNYYGQTSKIYVQLSKNSDNGFLYIGFSNNKKQLEAPLSAFVEGWPVEMVLRNNIHKGECLYIGLSGDDDACISIDSISLEITEISAKKILICVLVYIFVIFGFVIARQYEVGNYLLKLNNIWLILGFVGISVVTIILKVLCVDFESSDYIIFNSRWVETMRNLGISGSLRDRFTNYPPMYITMLSIVSQIPISPVAVNKIIPNIFTFL